MVPGALQTSWTSLGPAHLPCHIDHCDGAGGETAGQGRSNLQASHQACPPGRRRFSTERPWAISNIFWCGVHVTGETLPKKKYTREGHEPFWKKGDRPGSCFPICRPTFFGCLFSCHGGGCPTVMIGSPEVVFFLS